jgi:hypothetical protein
MILPAIAFVIGISFQQQLYISIGLPAIQVCCFFHLPLGLTIIVAILIIYAIGTFGAALIKTVGQRLVIDKPEWDERARCYRVQVTKKGHGLAKVCAILDDAVSSDGQHMSDIRVPLKMKWMHHREDEYVELGREKMDLLWAPAVLTHVVFFGINHSEEVPLLSGPQYFKLLFRNDEGRELDHRWVAVEKDSESPLGYKVYFAQPPKADRH